MLTLGIDTSAVTASVALTEDGRVIADLSVTGGLTHSEHLIPMIEDALRFTGKTARDIGLFAVDVGPGSFTGVRIGVSTVKGMAFDGRVPCVAVSTLEALAYRLLGFDGCICPVMDARRGEFYNALFKTENGRLVRLTPDRAIAASDLDAELRDHGGAFVNGDGAEKYVSMSALPLKLARPDLVRQNAAAVALVGERLYREGKAVTCDSLSPLYLRVPQAERVYNMKNKNEKGETKK